MEKHVGRNRIIQYVKGEKSIYKDEQAEKAKPARVPSINEGFLFVDFREVNLLNYLDKCNYNGSNKNRDPKRSVIFVAVEKGQEASEYVAKEKQLWATRDKIFNMSIDEKEALAMVLKIPGWENKLSDELTRDIIIKANNDVEFFNRVI